MIFREINTKKLLSPGTEVHLVVGMNALDNDLLDA